MGRMKDLVTGLEVDVSNLKDVASPVQYQTIGDEPGFNEVDIDEVNFQLQLAADEAKEKRDAGI